MKSRPTILSSLALVIALSSVSVARSAAPRERSRADQRASLVSLLSAYHLDMQRPLLDAVGPDVPDLLIDIASRPNEFPRVRVRALAALAFYPTETALGYLRAQLFERAWIGNGLGTQIRRQALRSLGRGFGERALDDIVQLKDDSEPLVREAVALAMGDARSLRAVPVLETWLAQEQTFTVRDAVDHALRRLREQ